MRSAFYNTISFLKESSQYKTKVNKILISYTSKSLLNIKEFNSLVNYINQFISGSVEWFVENESTIKLVKTLHSL